MPHVPTKLEEIIAATRLELASTEPYVKLATLEAEAARHQPRGFRQNLKCVATSGPAVIAELKKASPSKGLIRAHFPVAKLARELEESGAAALSVLTNKKYFQGALENLEIASSVTKLPCLRKEFIIDEFQVVEARAVKADAILLIVAALSDPELKKLRARADQLELDVLCEVHDGEELKRALDLGFDTIGVNNRNLHTFKVDLNTSLELADRMPSNVLRVAESGIEDGAAIGRLRQAGFDAFLVGESLMRAEYPGDALQELLSRAATIP